jgi:hypothetical protein
MDVKMCFSLRYKMYKQDWKLELQNFELKNKPQDIVTEVKSILYK